MRVPLAAQQKAGADAAEEAGSRFAGD